MHPNLLSVLSPISVFFTTMGRSTVLWWKKTRVESLWQLNIPKLELEAADMCARLWEAAKENHTCKIDSCHSRSDCRTFNGWINNTSRCHPAFIANRVTEIHDFTSPERWRHVPSWLNVADDGSRGLRALDLRPSSRWLNGPAFLSQPEQFWPRPDNVGDEESVADSKGWMNATAIVPVHFLYPNCFSSWDRLLRVTSSVLRFLSNCRRPK